MVYYKVTGDRGSRKDINISGCLKLSEREALRLKRKVEKLGFKNVTISENRE